MYQNYETEISKGHLSAIFSQMKEPVCLLGGWAVYLTVNTIFNKNNGRDYLGSRDIDLGFHIDPKWSTSELATSAFAQSIEILKGRGFDGVGSRFVKYYDINTRKELSKEESRKKPAYDMFQLYVDPMVDAVHQEAHDVVGFPLLDEPLLSSVFAGKQFISLADFGGKFMLPIPEILVATKIKSVPNRTKDDKRIKDIADIYALSWYSGIDFSELKKKVQKIIDVTTISSVVSGFTKDEYEMVSNAIGIGPEEISRVIIELAR